MDKQYLFICNCNNVEHQLIFSYWENEKVVYCNVHLKPERNVFKRIWRALQYIVGHRSVYGDFDEFIFNTKDAERLQKIVDFLKQSDSNS